ncbi:bifunctional phosphoribosyl-AMP cyclohydrolase/phosphoribosyl-ATP diphosphatase HisIE [Candidatus Micrarchaeota archaeon]|nr:bifunctional phosphoribosyl-AMP cyclohydrolase/phosphoribosyl-ATP diphosphatase HisIE [Candidatus Micrarchaeota archaeon]
MKSENNNFDKDIQKDKSRVDQIKFDNDGLVPIIVQDANTGVVLSLVYANSDAVCRMQETGFVWRYSRSKKKIMQKGEESGNVQRIVSIDLDCDKDALLVRVLPEGPACHLSTVSCFGSEEVADMLSELALIIKDRRQNQDSNQNSYTAKVVSNRELAIEKLREECEELIEAKEKKDLIWEAADLLYFTLVYFENREVEFGDVLKELRRRRLSH